MKIVIDIPHRVYKLLKDGHMLGTIDSTMVEGAILNGTPLPKGHGRLIDADDLDASVLQEGFAYALTKRKLRYTAGEARQKIANAPTIIKADKEVGE